MAVTVEHLSEAGRRYLKKMDLEDMAALKICLLSTGALMGLSLKSRAARRMAGVACSFLAAGLAIPLVSQYLDELDSTPAEPEPLKWENLVSDELKQEASDPEFLHED